MKYARHTLIGFLVVLFGIIYTTVGCAADSDNQVSSTDQTEIKLVTDTISTEAGTAVCVIAINTEKYVAPGLDCIYPDIEDNNE